MVSLLIVAGVALVAALALIAVVAWLLSLGAELHQSFGEWMRTAGRVVMATVMWLLIGAVMSLVAQDIAPLVFMAAFWALFFLPPLVSSARKYGL